MSKMQRRDGSMFHKVAGLKWPGFDKSPDTDTQDRYIFGSCTSSAAMSGASFAIASRIYAPFDPSYAAAMRKRAERIWGYLAKTKTPIYRVDEGQEGGSGPYNKSTDLEERIWLAAELFRTTGEKKYEKYLGSVADRFTQKPGFFTWDNTLALGQFAYLRQRGLMQRCRQRSGQPSSATPMTSPRRSSPTALAVRSPRTSTPGPAPRMR